MRNVLAAGLLLVALAIFGGCSGQTPVGTLRLTDHLAFGGTVVDTRTDGAVLLQTQGHAPVLVPAEHAVFQVGDRVVPPSELLPGSTVMATLGPQEARIVSVSPSVVTLHGDQGVFQVPLSALPPPVQTSTFVQVERDDGISVLPLQQVVSFVGPTSTLLVEPVQTLAWDPYAVQRGILLGRHGEHLLVAAPSGGLYTIPQGRVDLVQGVHPGSAVLFTTTDRGLFLEPWTLERRTGLLSLDPLDLNLQLVQRLDGAALVMTPDDTTFLLPGGIPLRVDGRLMPLASVPLGTWVTATLPATTAELLTLDGSLGTFLTPQHGVVQLPLGLIPTDSLAQARVQVRKRNGKSIVVPLVAALNMQRAQGATITPWLPPVAIGAPTSTQGVLTSFTGEHILLASADGGRLRLRKLPQNGLSQPLRRWVGRPVEVAGPDRDFRLHPWAERELALEVKRGDNGGGRDKAGDAPRLHPGGGGARVESGGSGPRVHSGGGGNGGGNPRVHSGGGGNGAGNPRVHAGGGGNGGGAPRIRSGGGGGSNPRVHSGGANGGGGGGRSSGGGAAWSGGGSSGGGNSGGGGGGRGNSGGKGGGKGR